MVQRACTQAWRSKGSPAQPGRMVLSVGMVEAVHSSQPITQSLLSLPGSAAATREVEAGRPGCHHQPTDRWVAQLAQTFLRERSVLLHRI